MIRKSIPKHIRQQVYEKYGGHCAYCGKALEYKDMQVDHMIPLLDKFWAEQLLRGMQYSESSLTKGRKKVPEMDWNVGPKTKEAMIRIIGMKKLEDGDE